MLVCLSACIFLKMHFTRRSETSHRPLLHYQHLQFLGLQIHFPPEKAAFLEYLMAPTYMYKYWEYVKHSLTFSNSAVCLLFMYRLILSGTPWSKSTNFYLQIYALLDIKCD